MTGPGTAFRLLDTRVGWDARPDEGLTGVTIAGGALRLASTLRADGGSRPPALLARSRDGTWWLAGRGGLRRLGPCDAEFRAWQERRRIRDLAVLGRRVAIVLVSGRVKVFDAATGRLLVDVWLSDSARVDVGPDGGLLVTDRRGCRTWLDASGLVCDADPPCRAGDPLPRQPEVRPWPEGADLGENGFGLPGRGRYDWRGRHLSTALLAPNGDGPRLGQYLSTALDSGVPGCHWHRIRIDADVPEGTSVDVAFATTDGPAEGRTPATNPAGAWSAFPAGDPHPTDWVPVLAGARDSMLVAPPGRYGYLRLRMTGTPALSPSIYQVRLDLPRSTSLEKLPAAYAEDPDARDFTERFLAVFDAQLQEIDEVLDHRASLLDADALPDDALGWLAGLLGTGFETEMSIAARRAILRAAPGLFRRRGTPQGLVQTLESALGVRSSVEELGTARPWGALGRSHLGSVRLFSRSRSRVRLGSSRLGAARVDGRGNPDNDALLDGAHRIVVHVPAGTDTALVSRVVRSQIPAHIVFDVSAATAGFVATTLRLGVDTVLDAPSPAVVGDVALGRRGVVRQGSAGGIPFLVGRVRAAGSEHSDGKEMECTC